MNNSQIGFGMIPSPPDDRDFPVPPGVVGTVPSAPYTTKYRPNKRLQGATNSCAAQSMAQWIEAAELKQRGVRIPYSPGYIYGISLDGQWKNEGMIPRELLLNTMRFGVVRESMFSKLGTREYTMTELGKVWSSLDGEGIPARIRAFVRLRSMADVYAYMTQHDLGILFACRIYESYLKTGDDKVVPPPSGEVLGGHMQYAPDIVEVGGRLLIATQNTWLVNGQQTQYIDPTEQTFVEMWGPIPDDSPWYTDMPREIMFSIPVGGRRNDYMHVDGKRVDIPVGAFYLDGKMCCAMREPFEAIGAKVEWYKMPGGSSTVIIKPRGG